eukprot:scaffold87911_cov18-Tisochrysis_lutea.AAC.1
MHKHDVGAADGQVLSNTAKLDALGWHGIALDPLLKNFEGRKNTRTLHAAVYGEANIEVDFAVCPHGRACPEGYSAPASTPAISDLVATDPNLSGVASHLTCYRDQVRALIYKRSPMLYSNQMSMLCARVSMVKYPHRMRTTTCHYKWLISASESQTGEGWDPVSLIVGSAHAQLSFHVQCNGSWSGLLYCTSA